MKKKISGTLLKIFSFSTLVNVLIFYWVPIYTPPSSFTVVKMALVSFYEKEYHLFFIGFVIAILLFVAPFLMKRSNVVLPGLAFLYTIYDFVSVFFFTLDGFKQDYIMTWQYLISLTVDVFILTFYSIYLWGIVKQKRIRHNKTEG